MPFNWKQATKLRRSYETDPQKFVVEHVALMESKQLSANSVDIGDMYFACFGEERFNSLAGYNYKTRAESVPLLEANDMISAKAFDQITGQIVYNRTRDAFELHPYNELFNKLCDKMRTPFLFGEKVAGIGGFGDVAQVIKEGQNYPEVGLAQEWITTAQLLKKGFIASVTREALISDRTGQLGQRLSDGAAWLALNRFKQLVQVVVGGVNNYFRNGVNTNTYLNSGAYVNAISPNPLVDYTSLEIAHLAFFNNVDPNTNEPILLRPDTLICPMELEITAERIRNAQFVRVGDGSGGTVASYSPNPVEANFPYKFEVVASPYIKLALQGLGVANPAARWFYGVPKKAFLWSEGWDIETVSAGADNFQGFERDLISRYKVGFMGAATCQEARYTQQDN